MQICHKFVTIIHYKILPNKTYVYHHIALYTILTKGRRKRKHHLQSYVRRLRKWGTNSLPSSVEDSIKLKIIEVRVSVPATWWGECFFYRNFGVESSDQSFHFPARTSPHFFSALKFLNWIINIITVVVNLLTAMAAMLCVKWRFWLINGFVDEVEPGSLSFWQVVGNRELLQQQHLHSHGGQSDVFQVDVLKVCCRNYKRSQWSICK